MKRAKKLRAAYKPRNPVARALVTRRGGAHRKSAGALRKAQKDAFVAGVWMKREARRYTQRLPLAIERMSCVAAPGASSSRASSRSCAAAISNGVISAAPAPSRALSPAIMGIPTRRAVAMKSSDRMVPPSLPARNRVIQRVDSAPSRRNCDARHRLSSSTIRASN
ncbi:MAG: hypothetical protein FJY37_10730 [Betaproteobacteria bacterium]|nr:hypothetical protein [Betaproteobacteria bacterium]